MLQEFNTSCVTSGILTCDATLVPDRMATENCIKPETSDRKSKGCLNRPSDDNCGSAASRDEPESITEITNHNKLYLEDSPLNSQASDDVSICSDSSEMTPSVITILSDEKGTAKDIKRGSSDANDEQAVCHPYHEDLLSESCSSQSESSQDVKSSNNEENQSFTVTKEQPGITIQTVNNKGSRLWDKKHYCVFCMKQYAKIPRHMEQCHSSENEVASILCLPKSSKERKSKWDLLRNKGNMAHNNEIIKEGKGEIIPFRRPSVMEEKEQGSYLPCSICFAFIKKTDLWKHMKVCKKNHNKSTESSAAPHDYQKASKALLPVADTTAREFRKYILDDMRHDNVSLAVRQDKLASVFGSKMFAKHGHESHMHQYIRQKLREVGRLLISARKYDQSINCLEDCIDPTKFKVVVQAVRDTCGYDSAAGTYGTPSLALKLGHNLKNVSNCLISEALQSGNESLKLRAEAFKQLCEIDWSTEVSSQALGTMHERRYNQPRRIPLAEDVKLLNNHLYENAAKAIKSLQSCQDTAKWRELCEITLAQVTLFNRRRGGEVQRIKVQAYMSGVTNGGSVQEEVAASLSQTEKELVKKMDRVEFRGKRGRKVAVILTQKHKQQIDLLISLRDRVDIDGENTYLFPRTGQSKTTLRSCDVIQKYASLCGAKEPHLLTSTQLRKHIAIISQLLNLKDNELDILAKFLGHDVRIHREFYRLPDATIELAKVSKLLLRLENGTFHGLQGKSLDEITITADEVASDTEERTRDIYDGSASSDEDIPESEEPETTNSSKAKNKIICRKTTVVRRLWTAEEQAAVQERLGVFLRLKKCPGKRDCEAAASDPRLINRSWKNIKFYVNNQNASKKS